MLLGLSGTALSFVNALVSKDLVDIITGHNAGQLISTFISMIGMTLASTLVSQVSSYFSTMVTLKVENNIKAELFEKIMYSDWEELSKYRTGDLLVRWSGDAASLASAILNYIPNIVIFFIRFIIAFAMMAYYDFSFALIALAGMPFSIYISSRLTRKLQRTNMTGLSINSRVSSFNQEAFSNIQTVKAFNLISYYIKELKSIQAERVKIRLSYQKIQIIISVLMVVIGLIVSYVSYGWGIFRVWSGVITYGTMTMFLSLSSTLSGALNNLVTLIPSGVSINASASRLMEISELDEEKYGSAEEVEEFHEKHGKSGIEIAVEDITYAYRNGNIVFEGASMDAKPNEIVALIGPSGQGKTTMLRLLLSLIRPKEGNISLIGEDGNKIELVASARQLMSYVPQGNTIFSGTIAGNLRRVKQDATDEEIIAALKKACAWEFVEKLPNGINSEVKERGGGFSEGQAQRLSIARAFLRHSPILLLDEATSALDPQTAKEVLKNIVEDEYPRTCILTTHRPGMLKGCSRVYRISDRHCKELTKEEIQDIIENA